MSYVRHYIMQAADGATNDLGEALSALATAVRPLYGSLGVELFRDVDRPGTHYFIERWDNKESQRAAGALLPANVMKGIRAALASAPVAANLSPIMTEP